jgi:DNA-binding GntR family transcriptional regulator
VKVVAQKRFYEQAYDIVKLMILNGEIKPGSTIIMVKLSEQLNISRTPLREALRQLQNEGLVNIDHTGKIYVIDLDEKEFNDLCECRLTLEKEIIRMVVQHITDSQLAEVEKVLKESEEAAGDDYVKMLMKSAEFHDKLVEACPNKHMLKLLERVRSHLLIYRANIHKYHEHSMEISREHRQIFEAVKQRDENKAVDLITQHLKNDQFRGLRVFREGQGSV